MSEQARAMVEFVKERGIESESIQMGWLQKGRFGLR